MRNLLVAVALAAVTVPALSAATAAAPVQPLELWSPAAGSCEVELGVSVVPHGLALPLSGGTGKERRAAAVEYAFWGAGAATCFVTEAVGLSLQFQTHRIAGRLVLQGEPPKPWRWEGDGPELRFGAAWRRSTAEAAWRVDLDYGGKDGVATRFSYVAVDDPLVLSAGVDVDDVGPGAREVRLGASVGVALAANDDMVLGISVRHRPALVAGDLPETTLTLGAVRVLSGTPPRHVGFETIAAVRGDDVRVGFGVSFYAAGRRR